MSAFSSPDNISFIQNISSRDVEIKETPENDVCSAYQLERCISWIKKHNYQKTCLQFPDKNLNDGVSVALYLEKVLGKTLYLLADTSFGSCCVDHISAEHVKADSIIHFGHACLSPFNKLPVLYIFEKEELDVKKFKNTVCQIISNNDHVIIFYSDVYHHLYRDLCESFQESNVSISRLTLPDNNSTDEKESMKLFGRSFQLPAEGDIVGIFIGEDCSTLQNLALALPDIKWYNYTISSELNEYNISRSKFLMKKYHQMELVKDADVLGILIGTLGVDNYLNAIDRVKLLAKNHGKKCYILAVGRPNVCKLANFPEVDVFVSIACSENLSKDFKDYYKPVVSLFEVEMALGNHLFRTEYLNDFCEVLKKFSTASDMDRTSESDVSLTTGKIRSHMKVREGPSTDLQEKMPGALIEAKGAAFLSHRSWKGLDPDFENRDIVRAEVGRSGIPLGYQNEFNTLKEENKN